MNLIDVRLVNDTLFLFLYKNVILVYIKLKEETMDTEKEIANLKESIEKKKKNLKAEEAFFAKKSEGLALLYTYLSETKMCLKQLQEKKKRIQELNVHASPVVTGGGLLTLYLAICNLKTPCLVVGAMSCSLHVASLAKKNFMLHKELNPHHYSEKFHIKIELVVNQLEIEIMNLQKRINQLEDLIKSTEQEVNQYGKQIPFIQESIREEEALLTDLIHPNKSKVKKVDLQKKILK